MHSCVPAAEAPKELEKIEHDVKHRAKQADAAVGKASKAVARAAAEKGMSREQLEARGGTGGASIPIPILFLFLFLFCCSIRSLVHSYTWSQTTVEVVTNQLVRDTTGEFIQKKAD